MTKISQPAISAAILTAITPASADHVTYQKYFQDFINSLPTKTVEGRKVKAMTLSKVNDKQVVGEYFVMNDGNVTYACEAKKRDFPKIPKQTSTTRVYGGSGGETPQKTWNLDCYADTTGDGRPEIESHSVVWDYDLPSNRISRGWHPTKNLRFRPAKPYVFQGHSKDRETARRNYWSKGPNAMNPGQHFYMIPYNVILRMTHNHRRKI